MIHITEVVCAPMLSLTSRHVDRFMSDRRRSERLRVKLPVRYHSDAVYLDCWVHDLSRNGLFLRSDYLDALGNFVGLRLTLRGEDLPVQVDGEVVRIDERPRSAGMGIRFTEIGASERRRLANFMIERNYEARHLA